MIGMTMTMTTMKKRKTIDRLCHRTIDRRAIGRLIVVPSVERQELVYRSLGPWPEFRSAQGAMLLVDFSLLLVLRHERGFLFGSDFLRGSDLVDAKRNLFFSRVCVGSLP